MAFLPRPSVEVKYPPVEPPLHSLVDVAFEIEVAEEEDWQNGILFSSNPTTCDGVAPWLPYTDDPADKPTPGDVIAGSRYHSFYLTYTAHCQATPSTLKEDIDKAKDAIVAGTPKAIESIFWGPNSGTALADLFDEEGENFSLTSATPQVSGSAVDSCGGVLNPNWEGGEGVITPFSPKQAYLSLTQALGNCGTGARGVIHAPVYLVESWAEDGLIRLEDPSDFESNYVTNVRGDYVVGGSGYSGAGPDWHDLADPADGYAWAYASAPVGVKLSDPEERETTIVDHTNNIHKVIVERLAVIQVNPSCVYAAYVDVP